jgi:hypothetical protein
MVGISFLNSSLGMPRQAPLGVTASNMPKTPSRAWERETYRTMLRSFESPHYLDRKHELPEH